jgi:hypothetical protein
MSIHVARDADKLQCTVTYDYPFELVEKWKSVLGQRKGNWDTIQHRSDSWAGGTTHDGVEHGIKGNTKIVARVEDLFNQLDEVETPRPVWQPTVAGAYPVIGDYLAGNPLDMRRKQTAYGDTNPIRIVFDVTTVHWLPHKTITDRGVAVLALANKLAAIRPVELVAIVQHSYKSRYGRLTQWIPIGHSPINIAQALGVLASGPYVRMLSYDLAHHWCPDVGSSLPFAWSDKMECRSQEYVNQTRVDLGLGEEDLCFGPAGAGDDLATKPFEFIKRTIERLYEAEEVE